MTNPREKILIIKLGALGDIILSLEGFHSIRARHPDSHLTVLTRPQFAPFLSKMPWFDEVLCDPKPKFYQIGKWLSFRKMIRGRHFRRVYDHQCNDRTAFYFKLIGPARPEWCGSVKGCSHRRPDLRRDRHGEPMPSTEWMLSFLESVGVPRAGEPNLTWFSGDLSDFHLPEKFVMLVPGCSPQHPHKRWPAAHFAKLVEQLAERGIRTVAVGTKVDQESIDEICSLNPSLVSLAGKTDLGQLAEVSRKALGVVGNDTGPIHIAAMVGAPTLVLMSGKSHPIRMIPRGPDVGFLQREHLVDLTAEDVMPSIRMRNPIHTAPKALILDRDGTLIEHVPYLADPADVRLIPGVREALSRARQAGTLLFLHSNQSGIGRGLFGPEAVEACNARMIELLGFGPRVFERICIAPEQPEAPSTYRKPSAAFAKEVMQEYKLSAGDICYIGDRGSDLATAHTAGTRGVGVATGLDDLRAELKELGLNEQFPVFDSLHAAICYLFASA
jgi:HAD superfamily hydrolase (TIGR01662 family)